ncbi:MAG: biotin--[acetyl-CoA-carboxylase] ligase [Polaribacter sp.]|nr:biotin--[acetyl-CoA-carboxylase] ligase [Polaribacter sp.]
MKIIKLDAIDSTNSFLKEMAQKTPLQNYTVVTASVQKKGKGQMGAGWVSEPHKNLLCSVFVAFDTLLVKDQVFLNYAVSIAVYNVLKEYELPKLQIKWPNDIMSDAKKISGILIENIIQSRYVRSTVIGIGINVNQVKFPQNLPNATSIKKSIHQEIDIDILLQKIVIALESTLKLVTASNKQILESRYIELLYKKNTPTMFRDDEDVLFMGMVIGVSSVGKLQVQLEDDSVREFGIKEVSFA